MNVTMHGRDVCGNCIPLQLCLNS